MASAIPTISISSAKTSPSFFVHAAMALVAPTIGERFAG
jgi:hypothetical protein